ncbi:unnamed protein product [Brassicogethes aeneus]|uniref:Adipokinetic hormone 2 n=1 Tax=Brassicogethes aeneus TaxID=1431903 RepID=A0A9P0FF97_BRAAE|nr:unnamed protein product [Brassicogethes aeneus]
MAFLLSRIFVATTLMVLFSSWVFMDGAQAQVTFSRDWNPGKRNIENFNELRAASKSVNAICHMLINQIRQMVSEDELPGLSRQ